MHDGAVSRDAPIAGLLPALPPASSVRPVASSVLFHSPSIGSRLSATVYLTSAPVFQLRITTTAIAPGGAFSAAIVSVRWPGLAIVAIMPHPRCTRTW